MSPSKLALRNSYQKNIIKYSRADFKTANPMVLALWHRASRNQFETCKSNSLGVVESWIFIGIRYIFTFVTKHS